MDPAKEEGPWAQCSSKPAIGLPVTVKLADNTTLSGTTDATGVARIDLQGIGAARKLVENPTAEIAVAGRPAGRVDLTGTPSYAHWKQSIDAQDFALYMARQEAERAATARKAAAEEAERQYETEMTKKTASWTKMTRVRMYQSIMDLAETASRVQNLKGEYEFRIQQMEYAQWQVSAGPPGGESIMSHYLPLFCSWKRRAALYRLAGRADAGTLMVDGIAHLRSRGRPDVS